jgi:hypothetical protein
MTVKIPVRLGRSKYRAVPTIVDNIRFHSKKEANRYSELKLLQKAGEISNLALQPSWPLRCGDKTIGKYVGDFAYNPKEHPWTWVVEDVKGMKTPLYRWKKKHFEAQYGIEIREV